MARKSGSTISQEELYPPSELRDEERVRHLEELDDARLLDLDAEQEAPFLRGQKRVSVRRGALPRKTATGLAWATFALCIAGFCVVGVAALYHYGEHSWRFRIESGDDIEITGLQNVTRPQVMEVMGADIGRNIFFIPLTQRKAQLGQIPWVQSASVMRFVPNHLKVEIRERMPVAFARIGSKIFLIDDVGTLMDLPASKRTYSFPVILGMNAGEPPSTRRARMKIYNDLVGQLDSSGAHYSQDLSEVDLSDLDDVKVLANSVDGNVLVHLGSSKYLDRYKVYVAHVKEWRQQFDKVDSVDLRYDGQIIVNPDSEGTVKQVTISTSAARKAIAASVKPAAYISRETVPPRDARTRHPAPIFKPAVQKELQKNVEQKASRPARRRAVHKSIRASKANASKIRGSKTVSLKTNKPVNNAQDIKAIANSKSPEPLNVATKKKPSPAILKQQEQ